AGNAETTGALSINTTAGQLLTALNTLSNLKNQVGSFTVTKTGNVFTVIYGNALTPDVRLDRLVWSGTTNGPATVAAEVNSSGGAQLQLQGSLTIGGENLTLQGSGWAQSQYLTLGGTSGTFTLNLLGKATSPLAYNATKGAVQTALATLSTVTTPPEIQTIQV